MEFYPNKEKWVIRTNVWDFSSEGKDVLIRNDVKSTMWIFTSYFGLDSVKLLMAYLKAHIVTDCL